MSVSTTPVMSSLTLWEDMLWPLRNVLMAALLARLFQAGAFRRYPVLTAYLGLSILRSAALASVRFGGTNYGTIWMFTEPLIWIGYGAVCWEVYGLVFAGYHGIAVLGRRTLILVLSASFVLSFFLATRSVNSYWDMFPFLREVGLSSRVVVGTFFFFLGVLIAFLLWFRMVLPRNVLLYAVGFSALFLSVGVGTFLNAAGGAEAARYASIAMLAFLDLTLLVWACVFNPAGEGVRGRLGTTPAPVEEQQLLATLDSLNRLASAATKKI